MHPAAMLADAIADAGKVLPPMRQTAAKASNGAFERYGMALA